MKSVKKLLTTTMAKRHALSCLALTLLAGTIPASATQIIRDLWDGLPKAAMDGKGSDPSSVGLDTNTTWAVSPAGNTGLSFDNTWDVYDWIGINTATALRPDAGSGGTMAYYGGNMNSLTNPANNLPYGHWYSQCYATRALSTNAYIDFNANGTYYFSVRIIKGISWWSWMGDNAGGIGFASSGATNASFVGAGITRSSPFYLADGTTDAGNTCYITTGTLDQAGTGYNTDFTTSLPTDGGPYYPRAAGTNNLITDFAGLLLGKLTTTVGGASTLSVRLITAYGAVPSDPDTITWDATYSFTETNLMTHLLVWQYGTGPSVQDALRVGTTWGDVVGLELTGPIKATPASTVYAGTTVTLSQIAGINDNTTYPMSFQWLSNGVPILDATNASLALVNPTTDYTADYTIVVSNYFGMLTNTPIHVTINPAVPPYFTVQPASIVRYVGGYASFTVEVDGTPPFGLQLKHGGTNVPGATADLATPGTATLTVGPLALADALASYSVTATNLFGSTNSDNATLTFITPTAGSFEAAAVAHGATALWKLSDTTNGLTSAGVPLKEYMRGWDGLVPNEVSYPSWTNVAFVQAGPGPVLPGFSGVSSLLTPNSGWPAWNAQVNLPSLAYSNTMTMVVWMKPAGSPGGDAIFYDRNKDSGTNHFGIHYFNGSLGSEWGPARYGNNTDGYTNYSYWSSGITLPANRWVMVALVVEPNETTLYAGTDPFTLQSVTRSSIEGTNYANISDTLPNGRLVVGRTDYSWAQNDNAWGFIRGQFCNAAVFHQALSPAAISNLFVAGFGTGAQIIATNGGGNLGLDWYPSLALQEADEAAGPYTDVVDPNTFLPVVPPYTVPVNLETNKLFYRVYQVVP